MPFTGDQSIITGVLQTARTAPDKPALVVTSARDPSASSTTFGALVERAGLFAGGLAGAGFRAGDRILCAAPPSPDFYAFALALLAGRMPVVLIDGSLDRRRLLGALRAARARAIVSTAAALRRWPLVPPLVRMRRYAVDGAPWGVRAFHELLGDPAELPQPPADDTPGVISFTSGSTGRAKGVIRTHEVLLGQHVGIAAMLPARPDDVDMTCFPAVVLHNLMSGVATVLPPVDLRRPWAGDPRTVLEAIETWGVTRLSGAPAFIERLADEVASSDRRAESLRSVVVGGAPVSRRLCARVLEAFPDADCVVAYGATEAEPIAHVGMRDVLDSDGDGLLVGAPAAGRELMLALLPDRVESELPSGELEARAAREGEVLVAGPGVSDGYAGDPDLASLTKVRESSGRVWHRTGDLARRDDRGRLWLLGRRGQVVDHAGTAVYPLQLEALVEELPGVSRAALVGSASGNGGALAVAGTESALPEVRQRLEELGLAGLPVRRVESIPMDRRHHSKIDRPALARQLAGK
ncbi:MAG: AMP-binding protein [Gaiellaceae bacterium]